MSKIIKNTKHAISVAESHGLEVTKITKTQDGGFIFKVGNVSITHNGRDGAGCWHVNGGSKYCKGLAILAAVNLQTN